VPFSRYLDTKAAKERRNKPDELDLYLASNFELDNYNIDGGEDSTGAIDVLKFWKDNQKTFPNLALLARFIFSIPASTVASEGNFSKTGWTINDRRTQLDPETVNSLMFLHSNLE